MSECHCRFEGGGSQIFSSGRVGSVEKWEKGRLRWGFVYVGRWSGEWAAVSSRSESRDERELDWERMLLRGCRICDGDEMRRFE